jgi:glutathione reductase (NADPH)
MQRAFDVVVIGSGSAGTSAAVAASKRGRSVAVIDELPFGGTCALRGCDPKKVLVAAASVVDSAQRLGDLGIVDRVPRLDWAKLMAFKRTFTDPVPDQRLATYRDAGIAAIAGHARFVGPQRVAVAGDEIVAERIVIASGAKERHVAQGDDALLTSTDVLELERLPASLVFVGGGYISFELAHVAARAGAKVTILHADARPLAGFDADAVEQLLAVTREIGIDLQLEMPVKRVERDGNAVVAWAERGGQEVSFRAEAGVLAAGRLANIDALDLEAGTVERTKKGVRVNEYLQSTSNANVYAAGDAADGGGLPLTPVAGYEGEVLAANLLDGNHLAVDFHGLASMVYTIPPLGTTGIGEEAAKRRGLDVDVTAGDMTTWYSTRHVAGRRAFYKTVVEKKTGQILGATIFGPHAEEQINVLALAVRSGLKCDALEETLFAYPTGSSDLEYLTP